MCNISSQSFYRQIAAFWYFGSYILINSSKAFSASAFVSACQMLCNKPLTLLLGEFGKAVGDVHRFVHPASLLASLGTVSLPQGQSILSRFHPSCRSKGPSNIAMAMLPPETSSCAHRDGTRADQKVTRSPVLERTLGNLTVAGPKPICRSRSGK